MFPPVPPEVKSISHFLKVAEDHDQRNIVIAYWARMHAVQAAMRGMPGQKPPPVMKLLIAVMDWLEKTKAEHHDNEGITNETCAQAIIEEYALKLFNYADESDKKAKFDKNVIKAFYTSGILFDILDQFGEVPEDIEEKRKYARWRAAYIHNCLKDGLTPTPGNVTVLLSPEDEARYTGFVSKEELDRIKGRLPPEDDLGKFKQPASFLFEDSPFPRPVTPTGGTSISQPTTPTAGGVPALPDVPSESLFPQPVFPTVAPIPQPVTTESVTLTPEQMEKAQRYCKLANSAMTYDDTKTAIDNLQKALHLLQYGEEK